MLVIGDAELASEVGDQWAGKEVWLLARVPGSSSRGRKLSSVHFDWGLLWMTKLGGEVLRQIWFPLG